MRVSAPAHTAADGPLAPRIPPVWARSLREICTATPRAAFEELHPHAWLVVGVRGGGDVRTFTELVSREGADADAMLNAIRWYVDSIEVYPLRVRTDRLRPQHLFLGRVFRNDLALRDDTVSASHAILTYWHGLWWGLAPILITPRAAPERAGARG